MYKNLLLVAIISLLILACGSSRNISTAPNTLSSAERADGFQLLFDGSTTNGWHTYGRSGVGQAWKISDGALYFDTTRGANGRRMGGGDIVTNEEYENFHLKLEWK